MADEWAFGKFNINANPLDDLDEQVVDDGTANNVWRLSPTRTGSFSDQPNSPSSSTPASESTASLWNDRDPNHTRIRCDPYERANRCDKREQSICSETNPISPADGSRR